MKLKRKIFDTKEKVWNDCLYFFIQYPKILFVILSIKLPHVLSRIGHTLTKSWMSDWSLHLPVPPLIIYFSLSDTKSPFLDSE